MLLLVAVTAVAQDSYREAMKDYLKISQKQATEKMLTQLNQLNPMLFEYKQGLDYGQLTKRFINEHFLEVMTDMVQDVFKENKITESDIRQIIALMNTPQGETLREHSAAWSNLFEAVVKEEMEQPLMSAMEGEPISSSVVVNADIPESYSRKFMQYFEDTRAMDQFMGAFNQPLKMMGIPESFLEWLNNNIGTLAMNSAYGTITEADLDYSATLFNHDFYRHINDAAVMLSDNIIKTGATMILEYVDWMKDQGVPLSKMGEEGLKTIKSFNVEE